VADQVEPSAGDARRPRSELPASQLDDELDREELRDRYYGLLQELRVVLPGAQVLVAFLLTVPFAERFVELDGVERGAFFVALIASILAVVCFVAPTALHRGGGRTKRVARLTWAVRLSVAGLVTLAVALVAAVYCVARFVFDEWAGVSLAAGVGVSVLMLWALLPRVLHRHHAATVEP
jgi:hypothetical protein